MKKKVFLLLAFIVFVTSCSVEKRVYRKGYHVDWTHRNANEKNEKNEKKSFALTTVSEKETIETEEAITLKYEEPLFASQSRDLSKDQSVVTKKRVSVFRDEECGDIINFKKGDPVKAKVLEISPDEIKYKRCDNLGGPLIVVSKSEVYSIKFVNGREEHFFTQPQDNTLKSLEYSKKPHPLAIVVAAFAYASCLFGPLTAIIGLILAPIAKRAVQRDGKRYDVEESLDLIRGAEIGCWVVVGLTLLAVLYILLMFALLI